MVFNYNLVNKILEAIFPLPEEFGVVENEINEPVHFSTIQQAVFDVDPTARVCHGASKLVIVSSKLGDVVIKIPFNGYYTESKDAGELIWTYFYGADGQDESDYCLAEYEKFQQLKTYGLNCFVAKTLLYKKINNFRVFLQEYVVPKEDIYYNGYCPSPKSQKIAEEWYKQKMFDIDSQWIANCLDKYGESKVKKFLFYCNNIDPDILADTHSGNYGYRENNTPCILDYSNFTG